MTRAYWRMEPARKKLRRWVLGERNLPPESLTQQDLGPEAAHYSPALLRDLSELFLAADRELSFGFGFKFLLNVFKQMSLRFDAKEKKEFYVRSGYFRRLNQVSCAMTLPDFLRFLRERFEQQKARQPPVYATFEEFLAAFRAAVTVVLPKVGSSAKAMGGRAFPAPPGTRQPQRAL